MRYSSRTLVFLCFAVIGAGVFIIGVKWPFRTALFPSIVAISIFLTSMTSLLISLFGNKEGFEKGSTMDFKVSEGIDPKLAKQRALKISSWIIGFFFLIIFLGFPIAVPVFVFLYLKLNAKEGWGISLIFTGVTGGFFWGLFVWLLVTEFPEGWVWKGLEMVGIK